MCKLQMPTKSKKYTKKRRYRRYRRRRVPRMTKVVSTSSPIPDAYFTKLKYYEEIGVTTSAALGSYLFRLNSTYDPNLTGTGHQPYGRDQLATLYSEYKVYGCHYRIEAYNASGNYIIDVATVLKPNTALTTTLSTAAEKPYTQFRSLHFSPNTASKAVMRGYANPAKLMGMSRSRYSNEAQTGAAIGADPTEGAYLHLYWQNVSGIAGLPVQFKVYLTYYTKFFDRKPLGGS